MAYDSSASNRLAAVRAAIDACLTAQEYSVEGRRKQMALLRDLFAQEKDLMAQDDRAGTSMVSVAEIASPT